jgi:hypothetical protein
MKNFNETTKFKNTFVETDAPRNKVRAFISNFNTFKKDSKGFFLTEDQRVDYLALKDIAIKRGIKNIPTQEELEKHT